MDKNQSTKSKVGKFFSNRCIDITFVLTFIIFIFIEIYCIKPLEDSDSCSNFDFYINNIMTILFPLIDGISGIAFSVYNDEIYGLSIALFKELSPHNRYSFIGMLIVSIILLVGCIPLYYCGLFYTDLLLNVFALLYCVYFVLTDIAILARAKWKINSVVASSYKHFKKASQGVTNDRVLLPPDLSLAMGHMCIENGLDKTFKKLKMQTADDIILLLNLQNEALKTYKDARVKQLQSATDKCVDNLSLFLPTSNNLDSIYIGFVLDLDNSEIVKSISASFMFSFYQIVQPESQVGLTPKLQNFIEAMLPSVALSEDSDEVDDKNVSATEHSEYIKNKIYTIQINYSNECLVNAMFTYSTPFYGVIANLYNFLITSPKNRGIFIDPGWDTNYFIFISIFYYYNFVERMNQSSIKPSENYHGFFDDILVPNIRPLIVSGLRNQYYVLIPAELLKNLLDFHSDKTFRPHQYYKLLSEYEEYKSFDEYYIINWWIAYLVSTQTFDAQTIIAELDVRLSKDEKEMFKDVLNNNWNSETIDFSKMGILDYFSSITMIKSEEQMKKDIQSLQSEISTATW